MLLLDHSVSHAWRGRRPRRCRISRKEQSRPRCRIPTEVEAARRLPDSHRCCSPAWPNALGTATIGRLTLRRYLKLTTSIFAASTDAELEQLLVTTRVSTRPVLAPGSRTAAGPMVAVD